jgi:uncharacterized protein
MKTSMFQRYLYTVLAYGLMHLPTWAQTTPFENSLFWEIAGKGKTKMYVLGTHHFYPNDFAKNSPAIQAALKKAKMVVGEIVIDSNQMNMALKMLKYTFMPNNSLKELLSQEDHALLKKYFKENMKMDLGMMERMKPIVTYQMILVQKYADVLGKAKANGLATGTPDIDNSPDNYVQQEGLRLKKEVRGLEEIEDQAEALFNGYSLERQAQLLMELIKDEKSGSIEEMKKMNDLYESQDIEKLLALTQEQFTPQEMDILLTNRNNKWMPQLEKMLAGKKHVFVAVGAGHLAGKSGILTQLRAKGYAVKPVVIQLK